MLGEEKLIKLCNQENWKLVFNKNRTACEVVFENRKPIKSKFCVAYYCKSQERTETKKYWKIELKTGQHVKWVQTREAAEQCIFNFENK